MKVFQFSASCQHMYSSDEIKGVLVAESAEEAQKLFYESDRGRNYAGNDLDVSDKWRVDFWIEEIDISVSGIYQVYSNDGRN